MNDSTKRVAEEDFTHWLGTANPGAKFVYAETEYLSKTLDPTQRVATLALRAFYEGTVDLVQKRLSGPPDGVFRYIAIKRRNTAERGMPYWLKVAS